MGIDCAMKNAGVGVGIPDTGRRLKLIYEEDKKLPSTRGLPCLLDRAWHSTDQMIVSMQI